MSNVKGKKATNIEELDIEFEVTKSEITVNNIKEQPFDSKTILFEIDQNMIKKDEASNPSISENGQILSFDIDTDDFFQDDVGEKTQKTIIFNPADLKKELAEVPTAKENLGEKVTATESTKSLPTPKKEIVALDSEKTSGKFSLELLDKLDSVDLDELPEMSVETKAILSSQEEANSKIQKLQTSNNESEFEDIDPKTSELENINIEESSGLFLLGKEEKVEEFVQEISNETEFSDISNSGLSLYNKGDSVEVIPHEEEDIQEQLDSDSLNIEENNSAALSVQDEPSGSFIIELDGESELSSDMVFEDSKLDNEDDGVDFDSTQEFNYKKIIEQNEVSTNEYDLESDTNDSFVIEDEIVEESTYEEGISIDFSEANDKSDLLSEINEKQYDSSHNKEIIQDSIVSDDIVLKHKIYKEEQFSEEINIHSTIRALREERDQFLTEIRSLKSELKESEQMILTLRAHLEESKIENSILKKRQLKDKEDFQYKIDIIEEKAQKYQEIATRAESKRLKLEEAIRIDFNQVKHREKELENKLELLKMDLDTQINSRDQKILELRRKIDTLEFNMEASVLKEQQSQETKRKVEEKLVKVMKTLRSSILSIEDDVEEFDDVKMSVNQKR